MTRDRARTFSEWLSEQSTATQDCVLGRRRAQAYRAGRLAVTRYTDPPGQGLSLAELEATRPEDDE